jgi:hypothetical protein
MLNEEQPPKSSTSTWLEKITFAIFPVSIALVLEGALVVLGAMALRLNTTTDDFESYTSSISFTGLSFLGFSNWNDCQTFDAVAFLTLTMLVSSQLITAKYLTVAILCLHRTLSQQSCLPASIKSAISSFTKWHSSQNNVCDRFRINDKIELLLPGLYYKLILPEKQFILAVKDVREQLKTKDLCSNEAALVSRNPYPEFGQIVGMAEPLESAVEDVAYRIHDIGSLVEKQTKDAISQMNALQKVLGQIARTIA